MSMSRQERRQKARALAKRASETLVDIRAHLESVVPDLIQEIRGRIYAEEKEALTNKIFGQVMMHHAAYLRVIHNYGARRLVKDAEQFADFCCDMELEGTITQELVDLVKDECGVDFVTLQDALNERMEKRKVERLEAIERGRERARQAVLAATISSENVGEAKRA